MSSDSPLVSIVIPTYNYGCYVEAAVDSALAQTYSSIEVIVVDDGSTDDTRERLAVYGDRIRYLFQENSGLSAARNTGILAAKGDFIALLDSDDMFHPRKLEVQMHVFAQRPALGMVASKSFSDEPSVWADLPDESIKESNVILGDIVTQSRFGPSSVVIRKECFETVGLFDPTLRSVEDREMWIRIASRFSISTICLPLMWYRKTPGSMSRNAEKMEYFERVVLDRAFRMPDLAIERQVRLRALSLAALSAAFMYRDAGKLWLAFTRVCISLWFWPYAHKSSDRIGALTRLKFLCLLPKHIIRVRL